MYFIPSHLSSPATSARDLSGSVGSLEVVWFLGFTFFPHLVAVLWCKWGERAKKVQKKASVPTHCQPSLSQAMPAKTWPPSTGTQRGSIKVTGVSEDDPAELRGRHKTGNKNLPCLSSCLWTRRQKWGPSGWLGRHRTLYPVHVSAHNMFIHCSLLQQSSQQIPFPSPEACFSKLMTS